MASGPITSQQIDGETMETVRDFIFLGSRITADGDCCHEIKRRLLLGRRAMTNLDSILKIRDISLSTKVCLVKPMVFPVVMFGCESWTVKKVESEVAQSCPTLCDPMDNSLPQAPLSMGFSRQEYWSGLPFPSPGNLPTQGSNPGLSHCRQTLYHLSHQGSPR